LGREFGDHGGQGAARDGEQAGDVDEDALPEAEEREIDVTEVMGDKIGEGEGDGGPKEPE
jgi:hypothetical protein